MQNQTLSLCNILKLKNDDTQEKNKKGKQSVCLPGSLGLSCLKCSLQLALVQIALLQGCIPGGHLTSDACHLCKAQ